MGKKIITDKLLLLSQSLKSCIIYEVEVFFLDGWDRLEKIIRQWCQTLNNEEWTFVVMGKSGELWNFCDISYNFTPPLKCHEEPKKAKILHFSELVPEISPKNIFFKKFYLIYNMSFVSSNKTHDELIFNSHIACATPWKTQNQCFFFLSFFFLHLPRGLVWFLFVKVHLLFICRG